MSDPIFILGCHRSGTSVIAGLLHDACGVSMGELMPATDDNPLGYFEAHGVVDAHRDLLFQMERDWTCPPNDFRPGSFDLGALEEQLRIHQALPGVWAVKDPRTMFLLRAWAHLGLERARFVAVVRAPADTIRSIEKRDEIREDRAEAIVDAYLWRLAEIADAAAVPVIRFSSDGPDVLRQVEALAKSLELPWDREVAESFFDPALVRNRSPHRETNPAYDALLERAFDYEKSKVPACNLRRLKLASGPEWPLATHLNVRHARQRHELWELAAFSTTPDPVVVELLLDGARLGGGRRPGVHELHQIEVSSALVAGALLMRRRLRPDGVIAHGLLAERTKSEIEFLFRSLYVNTQPLAEMVIDAPAPVGPLRTVDPAPTEHPRPGTVIEIAEGSGWDHVTTERVSPGRVGLVFRKRVLTDSELIPVVTDLIASVGRIHAIDAELAQVKQQLKSSERAQADAAARELRVLRRRAESAERDLRRLRSRRSVRYALNAARPFRGIFRMVRTWKNAR